VHGTAMHYGVVPYTHIIANNGWMFLIRTMDTGTILHIYFIAHFYVVYIAPYHCVEPNTALVAHDYIAHNSGVWCNKCVVSKMGVLSKHRQYYRHKKDCGIEGRKSVIYNQLRC